MHIGNADGCGVPTIKPWNIDTVKAKMEQAKASGCFAVAMDVDAAGLPFLKNMTPPAGSKSVAELAEIVKLAERPFIVKGVMTVKGAAANNTGDAGADLKALSTIVKTAKTDTKGVAGVTLELEASEIFDGATGVTDENGSITGVKVQANPATHGIAEMTALGLQIWRNEINDMNKRLGELRDSADDANGVWARVYTGKAKYGNLGVTNK